ncbi:MAG: DNA primase [Rhodanobacter sp.]|nr:MAG: DNA primase [Rhodanobacter sp.]
MNRPQTRQTQPGKGWVQGRKDNNSGSNITTIGTPSQLLLPRLEGVIKTGKGWRARCPSHGGKSASLAITDGDNGTLLLHCFAGCPVHDVLGAVGLQVGDLFVRKDLRSMSPAERSQLRQAALLPRWRAALGVLATEANVLLIAACQLGDGEPLDDTDLTRLRVAAVRVFDAVEVLR